MVFLSVRVVGECRDRKQVVESDTQTTRFLDNGHMLNASTYMRRAARAHFPAVAFVTNGFPLACVAGVGCWWGSGFVPLRWDGPEESATNEFLVPRVRSVDLSNRDGDTYIMYRTIHLSIFDLPMSDGRQSPISRGFSFQEATNCHMVASALGGKNDQGHWILMRCQAVSRKRLRTARSLKLRHYGNSFFSVPVGFFEICSKPSH